MDQKYFEEIKARDCEIPDAAAPVFRDRHTLIAEVKRLTDQHQCDVHNIAAMQATLNQQAKNCEKMLSDDKQQIATLKKELEEITRIKSDYFSQLQSYIKAFRLNQSALELMCSDLLSAYASPINPENIDLYTKKYTHQAQQLTHDALESEGEK